MIEVDDKEQVKKQKRPLFCCKPESIREKYMYSIGYVVIVLLNLGGDRIMYTRYHYVDRGVYH